MPRFLVQVWDNVPNLILGYLPNTIDLSEDQEVNFTHTLKITYPATDEKAGLLTFRNIIRLVDTELPSAITGCVSIVDEDTRQIEVASISGLSVGDYVLIFDSPSSPTKSFVAKITAIDTGNNYITLSRMDFVPTEGIITGATTFEAIDGHAFQYIDGQTFAWLLSLGGPGTSTTGSPVIKWTGKTYRIWDIQEERPENGIQVLNIIANSLDYDLNDRAYIYDARSDVAFALASLQNVSDSSVTPELILDNVLRAEPRSYGDFRNGYIKGTLSDFLSKRTVQTVTGCTITATPTPSLRVTGSGTSFSAYARHGTIITTTSQSIVGVVDYVVSDTELYLQNLPHYSISYSVSLVFASVADYRTFQFDVSGKLRAAILQIAEVWEDENQIIDIAFNEDKSIDITRIPIPYTTTNPPEIRVGKNIRGTSRRLDVSKFGNSVFATGSTSGWINSNTGQFYRVGRNPTTFAYQRNTKDRFLLKRMKDSDNTLLDPEAYRIRELRWGDPLAVLHNPLFGDVVEFVNEQEIIATMNTVTGVSGSGLTTGGSLSQNGIYHFRISAILSGGEETVACADYAVQMSGSTGNGSIPLTWVAYTGASKYRIYRQYPSGNMDNYYESSSASITVDGNNTGYPGVPKEFEGTSYTNGLLLVSNFSPGSADYLPDAGVGQLKTIEGISFVGNASNLKVKIRVTSPFDIVPSINYDIAISKPSNSSLTIIKGFGLIEGSVVSGDGDSFVGYGVNATDKLKGKIIDYVSNDPIGASASATGYDLFYGHYSKGLVFLNHNAEDATITEHSKFTGNMSEITDNTRANEAVGGVPQTNLTLRFNRVNLYGGSNFVKYQITSPPQLVMEFSNEDYTITVGNITTNIKGLLLTVSGKDIYSGGVSGTYDVSNFCVAVTDATLDLSLIQEGMEIWTNDATRLFVSLVDWVDLTNRKIYLCSQPVNSISGSVVVYVTYPSPDFYHTTEYGYSGNIFSFTPHRKANGASNASGYVLRGLCHIIDADKNSAVWGAGPDEGGTEGIGFCLAVSTETEHDEVGTFAFNQILLAWTGIDGASSYELKRILLVRPNTYNWVSVEDPQTWTFSEGDFVVLLNTETGGALTVGKSLKGQSYIYGADDISSLGSFNKSGFGLREFPIKKGDYVKFPADSRIFVGARPVESALTQSTRRGDQRMGQICEVESSVSSSSLDFDIIKIKNDLDIVPQPGDRVELLTYQDQTSINTYGRVEVQESRSEIVDPRELIRVARTTLRSAKDPLPRYELGMIDFQFVDPAGRYYADEIQVGTFVRVVDADFGIDDSSFRVVKVTRDFANPIASTISVENVVKTLQRGFLLSTTRRLAKIEQKQKLLAYQTDSPRCIFFDTTTRKCRKSTPPNIYCNSADSNRDGRLTRNKDRISKFHCPSFTPPTNTSDRDKVESIVVETSMTSFESQKTVALSSVLQPNSKIEDQHSFHIPEPVAFITSVYSLDPLYNTPVWSANASVTVSIDRDNDNHITPSEETYSTGLSLKFVKQGGDYAPPAGVTIYVSATVILIGRYS